MLFLSIGSSLVSFWPHVQTSNMTLLELHCTALHLLGGRVGHLCGIEPRLQEGEVERGDYRGRGAGHRS